MWRLILPIIACATLGMWPWPMEAKPFWYERFEWMTRNYGYVVTTEDMLWMALYLSPWLWLLYAIGDVIAGSGEPDEE